MSLRLVFLGTGRFAVPCLEALAAAGRDVAAVVSQPDRGSGRGRRPTPPPVKEAALALGLDVLQPERIRDPGFAPRLSELAADLFVVVAYGQLLPRRVLDLAGRGAVNVHASLLPRHRGAAPIQWAIVSGDRETGVTTMQLDEGMDTGPILLARTAAIDPHDTADSLERRLAPLGAALLLETLDALEAGAVEARPQDEKRATRAPLLRKQDGRLDWTRPAAELERRVRGFSPWPGAFTLRGQQVLKVLTARVVAGASEAAPGTVLEAGASGLRVACGQASALLVEALQPESRRPMAASAWAAGARLGSGERLA